MLAVSQEASYRGGWRTQRGRRGEEEAYDETMSNQLEIGRNNQLKHEEHLVPSFNPLAYMIVQSL
jgi:hypothetical protein